MMAQFSSVRSRLAAVRPILRKLLLLCVAAGACQEYKRTPAPSPADEVAATVAGTRPFTARLHGSIRFTACANPDTTAFSVGCAAFSSNFLASRLGEIASSLAGREGSYGAGQLWAGALIDLLLADKRESIVELAVQRLEQVAQLLPGDAHLMNDLAVAYLIRASHTRAASDVFLALDAIEHASRMPGAGDQVAFNRALIREQIGLVTAGATAWEDFLARAGGDGGWVAEGRRRLDALKRLSAGGGLPYSHFADSVKREPQRARELVMDSLLVLWARSVRDDDRRLADLARSRVLEIGSIIAGYSGDSTVMHLGQEAERASFVSPDAFARGLLEATTGSRFLGAQQHDSAASYFEAAIRRLRPIAPTLSFSSELLHAFTVMRMGRREISSRTFEQLAARARGAHNFAFAGRATWLGALYLSEVPRVLTASERAYLEAAQTFERIGEMNNRARTLSQRALVLAQLGRDTDAMDAALASLQHRRVPIPAVSRWEPLDALAQMLTDLRLPHAALAMQQEATTVARETGRPGDLLESLLALSAALEATGQPDSSRAVLRAASEFTAGLGPGLRARAEADYALAAARLARNSEATDALARLERGRAFFASQGSRWVMTDVRWQMARLSIVRGDTAAGVVQLDSLADEVAVADAGADERSRMLQMALRRELMAQRIVVRVAAQDTLGALRAYSQLLGESQQDAESFLSTPVPAGQTAVAFAALPEQLVVWTKRGKRLMVRVHQTSSDSIRSLVSYTVRGIRPGLRGDDAATAAFAQSLIGDALSASSDGDQLVLLSDGALGALPFAALPIAGGPLVQRHSLRFVQTLAGLTRRDAPTPRAAASRVLVVGAPSHDQQLFPELRPLQHADAESDRVASAYGAVAATRGREATRRWMLQSLPTTELLHFAGHARISPAGADRSYFVMATSGGERDSNVVSARDIRRLDLRSLSLAVLSACATTSSISRRVTDLQGLPRAFLDAGTRAVVSTLWELDDRSAEPFMAAFHGYLLEGATPAEALAQVQRQVWRSGSIGPQTWAAVRLDTR